MRNYRRLLSGAALLAILVVAAITFNYRDSEAQGSSTGAARILITGPLPLPVTGSLDVSGIVSVRDVEVAARIPVQACLHVAPGDRITLPGNRRLTIEFLTARCPLVVATSGITVGLQTQVAGSATQHYFFPKFLYESSGHSVYGSSDAVRIYADAGTDVNMVPFETNQCTVSLSGFLSPV